MKHPATIMKSTPTGEPCFVITDYKGKVMLTSRPYDTEDEVRSAVKGLHLMVKTAGHNIVDQLPSTIAHK